MSAFKLNDEIQFSVMTPDGWVSGIGRIAAIFPAAHSNWLHVLQPGGTVRMIFEANAKIELTRLQAAA
ncbi:MAG TPA: hypothetical protein VF801_14655 [Rhodocyclaceae bacterium]